MLYLQHFFPNPFTVEVVDNRNAQHEFTTKTDLKKKIKQVNKCNEHYDMYCLSKLNQNPQFPLVS